MTTTERDEPGAEVAVRADGAVAPVVDAELVPRGAPRHPRRKRVTIVVVRTWQASPSVPAEWKRADTAKRAARSLAVRAALAPIRTYPPAVARGTTLMTRTWWRWVRCRAIEESAAAAGDLHKHTKDLTHHRRVKNGLTAGVVVPGAVAAVVLWYTASTLTIVVVIIVITGTLAVAGRRRDGSPGRKAQLGPRSLSWTLDPNQLTDRFLEAGIVKKDERLYLVERPHREGDGTAVVLDLPGTRKASDAVRRTEDLASALAVDEIQLILERVRGTGGHAGRLSMWVADNDPYARPPSRSPLADAETWDLWDGCPWGTVARGTRVVLPVVWTSLLVGAVPRIGKTYAARLPAAAAALDAFVRLVIFDGKGGKDWRPYELVAHRFGRGDTREVIRRLVAVLEEAVADVQRRFDELGDMDDELCPESKVTPRITRDSRYGMPLVVIAIDEVQVYLEDEEYGKTILVLLAYLARKAPAAGYSLILATQKPDSKVIPAILRDNLGTRFAMRVMTWQSSETILGTGTKVQGYDASRFLRSHRGVGLLLGADGETDLQAGEAITTRTDLLSIAEIRALCERGRAAREAAGTLTGDAAGDVAVAGVDEAVVAAARAQVPDEGVVDAELVHPLPPLLAAIVEYLDGDDRQRVPSAELLDEVVRERVELDMSDTAFGRLLRRWGAPTGRTGDSDIRGPRVADLLSAAARIEAGGPEFVDDATRREPGGSRQPGGAPDGQPGGGDDQRERTADGRPVRLVRDDENPAEPGERRVGGAR